MLFVKIVFVFCLGVHVCCIVSDVYRYQYIGEGLHNINRVKKGSTPSLDL